MQKTRLIAARFLVLIIQLCLTIIVLLSRTINVNACMYGRYAQSTYNTLDTQLIVAVSVSFGLYALEFLGILLGWSLLAYWQCVLSFLAHGAGSIVLLVYIFNAWCSTRYWYVFGFCAALPGVTELLIWMELCCCGKSRR